MSYRDAKDFLSMCAIEQDDKIRMLNPKPDMWINLRSEYGDVWHQIIDVYLPDDYYASLTFYKNDRGQLKKDYTYLKNVRNVVHELPDDARCIYGQTINITLK